MSCLVYLNSYSLPTKFLELGDSGNGETFGHFCMTSYFGIAVRYNRCLDSSLHSAPAGITENDD